MNTPISIFLPILGSAYGIWVGTYFHNKQRSRKQKSAIIIVGALLAVICISMLISASNK